MITIFCTFLLLTCIAENPSTSADPTTTEAPNCKTLDSDRYTKDLENKICFRTTKTTATEQQITNEDACICVNTKVDELATLELSGTYKEDVFKFHESEDFNAGTGSLLHVEAGGITTGNGAPIRVVHQDEKYYNGLSTVIVELRAGKVKNITFDDFCGNGYRKLKNGDWDPAVGCGVKESQCCKINDVAQSDRQCTSPEQPTEFVECNLNLSILVSWFGTDESGNYMESSGGRPSKFTAESAESFVRDAIQMGSGVKDWIEETTG